MITQILHQNNALLTFANFTNIHSYVDKEKLSNATHHLFNNFDNYLIMSSRTIGWPRAILHNNLDRYLEDQYQSHNYYELPSVLKTQNIAINLLVSVAEEMHRSTKITKS